MKQTIFAMVLCLFTTAAFAINPADVFQGQIILSTKPFKKQFNSNKHFISYMKRVKTKDFTYADGEDSINIEFMAFFQKKYESTEFPVTIYDITGGRRKVMTFPIYPDPTQEQTRILTSYTRLSKESIPDETRQYEMVITLGGKFIAETKFHITKSAKAETSSLPEGEKAKAGDKAQAEELYPSTGYATETCSNATIADNLDLSIPAIIGESMNIWANLHFVTTSDGIPTWKLTDHGTNSACSALDPNVIADLGISTFQQNLDIHIPYLIYHPLFGTPMNLWVDLQFISTDDGLLTWQLSRYGVIH